MRALADGELDAAAVLFRRYQVPLFNFFLRLGFAREMSEDLTQTVFERVIKYRESYREGMSFRTWVYQIARNVKARAMASQVGAMQATDFARDVVGELLRDPPPPVIRRAPHSFRMPFLKRWLPTRVIDRKLRKTFGLDRLKP